MTRWIGLLMVGALAGAAAGCGHTDMEMQAKRDEVNKLKADLDAANAQHQQNLKAIEAAQAGRSTP